MQLHFGIKHQLVLDSNRQQGEFAAFYWNNCIVKRSGGVTIDSHHSTQDFTLLTSALRGTFSKRYSLYPAFHDLFIFFIPIG